MPTISIFIRKDDLPKWKELEHKSEWLHMALNKKSWNGPPSDEQLEELSEKDLAKDWPQIAKEKGWNSKPAKVQDEPTYIKYDG